jgi:hypothetical protein
MKALSFIFILNCFCVLSAAQTAFVLQPDRVFDGERLHEGWVVVVEGNRITAVGPVNQVKPPKNASLLKFQDVHFFPA